MSTNVPVLNAGGVIAGALSVFIAPAGTREPVIDMSVANCGSQTIAYGASDDASFTAAKAATAFENATDGETGFGPGAELELSFARPSSTAWGAWIATSEELPADPTGFAKATSKTTKGETDYTVYWVANLATVETLETTVTFGGDVEWSPLGVHTSCDVSEGGVTVNMNQSVNYIRCAGDPGPVRAIRAETDLMFSFELNDFSAETFSQVWDRAAITHSPNTGGVGWRSVNIHRPSIMEEYAVCARGPKLSSYLRGGNFQMHVPYAVQSGSPAPVFTRSAQATMAVEFSALLDLQATGGARFGVLTHQDRVRS